MSLQSDSSFGSVMMNKTTPNLAGISQL
jgi:hypothetical protein